VRKQKVSQWSEQQKEKQATANPEDEEAAFDKTFR